MPKKYAEYTGVWRQAIHDSYVQRATGYCHDIVGSYDLKKLQGLFSVIGDSEQDAGLFARTVLKMFLNCDSEFLKAPL